MAINSGILKASDITASTTSAGYGQAPDQRKLYDFSDRVAELTPEESPFFTYLANVSKVATDDNVFRFLENRSQINHTDRSFLLADDVNGGAAVSKDVVYSFKVDTASAGAVNFLTKGMVFAVNTLDDANGYTQAIVRVESGPSAGSADSTFQGRVIGLSDANTATGYNVLSNNDTCQIIGT
jgi:hypothetical protein